MINAPSSIAAKQMEELCLISSADGLAEGVAKLSVSKLQRRAMLRTMAARRR